MALVNIWPLHQGKSSFWVVFNLVTLVIGTGIGMQVDNVYDVRTDKTVINSIGAHDCTTLVL